MKLSKIENKDKKSKLLCDSLYNSRNNQEQTKPERRQEKQFFPSTSTSLGNMSTYAKSIVGPD